MPPKNACKRAAKALNSNAPIVAITLGEEETPMAPTAPPSPIIAIESSYPLEPLLSLAAKALPPSNDIKDVVAPTNSVQLEPQANSE
jgi:hypothetical protein